MFSISKGRGEHLLILLPSDLFLFVKMLGNVVLDELMMFTVFYRAKLNLFKNEQ